MVLGAVFGLVLTGLFIVFAGQMARALFDQANAVRDLVTLERARIGSD
jgi:Na+-driven multidrug efflux pump